VQLAQWLQARSGQLKLGDFNRAEMPLFDAEKQKYCKYNNGHGYGNYRSPEEYSANDIDEKIDVWSFGNNIYGLLTGLWVFYENTDDDAVQVCGPSFLLDIGRDVFFHSYELILSLLRYSGKSLEEKRHSLMTAIAQKVSSPRI
jgi:serine/threonine protein kinase